MRKEDFARRDWFDLWLPDLAPSAPLVSYALSQPFTPARWASYARRYRAEMRRPGARRLLALLAALSQQTDFAIGCYCPDEARCHRSLLATLLREHGAEIRASGAKKRGGGASR